MKRPATAEQTALAVACGERAAVARALNLIEGWRPGAAQEAVPELLCALPRDRLAGRANEGPFPASHLIGVTGAPGVGKSSLIAALARNLRRRGQRVGVLAIDPSSPKTGGALLGDRVRIAHASEPDDGLFVRSLACRGEHGGLSPVAYLMVQVMLSAFDRVLLETVGVGQAEHDVTRLADTTCLVLQPESGDAVQFLKAGILELPELIVVNKADPPRDGADRRAQAQAEKTAVELRASIGLPTARPNGRPIPVILTSARAEYGVESLIEHLDEHLAGLAEGAQLERRRASQATAWLLKRLRCEFGQYGIERLGGSARLAEELAGARYVVTELERLRHVLLDAFGAQLP